MARTATVNRRSFVKGAALGGAAVATAAALPAAALAEDAPAADAPAWLGAEPEVAAADIVRTEQTTLLVIGAGTSGLACAATAADMGLDFILAEKLPVISESREYLGAVNSHLITEAGIEADKDKLLNELCRYASGKCDRDVIKIWVDESAEMVDWVEPMLNAAGQRLILPDYREGAEGGTDYYAPVTEHMTGTFYIPPTRNDVICGHIEESGNEIRFGWELVKLVHEDGAVSGAIFDTDDGLVQVDATYTVLATGGYAANAQMMSALQPDAVACATAASYNPPCNGYGIKCGIWAGGVKENDPAPMLFDRGVVEPGVDAGYDENGLLRGDTFQLNIGSQPFLKVNRRGKRFANESTPYDSMCFAAGRQPGGVFCQVFDANAPEDMARFMQSGCAAVSRLFMQTGGDVDSYLEYVECGHFKKAGTLEELADMLGFEGADKDAFLTTVDEYNGLYDAQEDTQYGKEAYRLSAIRTAPFYGAWFGASLLTTLDGLRVNASLQVLGADGEPVEGLYAIGDASGSFFATNYPEYLVGVAAGRSTTEGRHLAKQLAAAEGIDVEAVNAAAMEALKAAAEAAGEPAPADYVENGAIVAW